MTNLTPKKRCSDLSNPETKCERVQIQREVVTFATDDLAITRTLDALNYRDTST